MKLKRKIGGDNFEMTEQNENKSIQLKKKVEKETKEGERFTKREFSYQSFSRSFTLPQTADGEKIMEILEKIEVSARLLAEIISVVLITNRQHKNSQFWGQKTGCFARFDVFSS